MIGQCRSVLETVDIGLSLNSSDIEVAQSSLRKSRSTQFILISRTLNKQIQIVTRKIMISDLQAQCYTKKNKKHDAKIFILIQSQDQRGIKRRHGN